MVKKIAEKFNRLSRVHQRHRQTDDRQTTYDALLKCVVTEVVCFLLLPLRHLTFDKVV